MPRHSAAVYRRRRLAVVIALLLVLALVGVGAWLLIAQPWASGTEKPTSSPTTAAPTPSGSPSGQTPSADPSSEPTGPIACDAQNIVVAAVTDADSYQPGELPKLSISLTNNGPVDCTLDVGSATQRFTVASGDDVWWRSTDCQENPSSMIATLAAGATVVSKEPVVWDRTRSSVDTCAQENRPRAPGDGASYHVSVEIGGFAATETKQILLY
jgi:hypothetical protein